MRNTRYIVINTIPKARTPVVEPVYNFFTPDERVEEVSDDKYMGASRKTGQDLFPQIASQKDKVYYVGQDGKKYPEENIKGLLPRFIKITLGPSGYAPSGPISDVNGRDVKGLFEAEMINQSNLNNTPYDNSVTYVDDNLSLRLLEKLDLAMKLQGLKTSQNESHLETFFDRESDVYDSGVLKDLVNYNVPLGVLDVNDLGTIQREMPDLIQSAESTVLDFKVDRRYFSEAVKTRGEKDKVVTTIYEKFIDENERPLRYPSNLESPEFNLRVDQSTLSNTHLPTYEIKQVGFIVERFEDDVMITDDSASHRIFLTGTGGALIDTKIKYGKSYKYTVKEVFEVQYRFPYRTSMGSLVSMIHHLYITGDRSDPASGFVVDNLPPNEPDGIFYRLDRRKDMGLVITWQYPVNPKRDIKYYQIFKRSSINEPFTCIGEIDFDNSFVKSVKTEVVRSDKVIKADHPLNYFVDKNFNKDSTAIYTIAAVDAHGLTSGYGAQSRVSFDRSKNAIVLDSVSIAGAPKQYPNFFVDPNQSRGFYANTIAEDVMRTSGFSGCRIYFDPDAKRARIESSAPLASLSRLPGGARPAAREIIPVFPTTTGDENPSGFYKMTLLDVDRQKSRNFEIIIEDTRGELEFK